MIITNTGFAVWFGDDGTVYNCTLITIEKLLTTFSLSCIFTYSASYPEVSVCNNIVYDTENYQVQQRLVDFHANASTTEFDYNLYYAPAKANSFWAWYTTVCDNLVAWQTVMQAQEYAGAEVHSMYANPLFLETVNYAVDETSPAWESGYDLGYGTTIGYYQGSISKPSNRKNLILIW